MFQVKSMHWILTHVHQVHFYLNALHRYILFDKISPMRRVSIHNGDKSFLKKPIHLSRRLFFIHFPFSLYCDWSELSFNIYRIKTFSHSNSSKTTIMKKLCKSKKLVKWQIDHAEMIYHAEKGFSAWSIHHLTSFSKIDNFWSSFHFLRFWFLNSVSFWGS